MAVRVAIIRCENYETKRVSKAVHEAIELLGGIKSFVNRGERILLKPNMLSAREPKKGVTTHPAVLEAMIDEVRDAGAEVWMGDSPSGAVKGVKRCWERTGFGELAKRKSVRLINFESSGTHLQQIGNERFYFAKSVIEADGIINIPKFKTHGFTLYTGAVKNLFGTLPGFQKGNFHKKYPHPDNFSRILLDIYSCINHRLHLMDAILGMEGNGPATGKRRMVGLILASSDGVALDVVASHIMGFKENEIDVIRLAKERKVGETDIEKIQIVGESLEDVVIKDFELPSNRIIRMIPQSLIRWGSKFLWVRPEIDHQKCTGCKICFNSCPVGAIKMVNDRPVVNYKICINCLCCNESCPEGAITQKLSWLARRVG